MTPEERFQHEKEAFRFWISDKNGKQLEDLQEEIGLRKIYLKTMEEKYFFPWAKN